MRSLELFPFNARGFSATFFLRTFNIDSLNGFTITFIAIVYVVVG